MGCRKVFLISWLILVELLVVAQIKEVGLPFVNNYYRDEYNAGTQNWSITQDSAGLMYYANNDGVLKYDGTNWRLYKLPNNSKVRSVSSVDNKLYAGGYDEFGYFAADKNGSIAYTSLSDKLVDKDKKFDEIWRIFHTKYGIVFQSYFRIFILKAGENYKAAVIATDHENDSITYRWEVMAESTDLGLGGDFENRPETLLSFENDQHEISFESPRTPGAYRLFVYVTDEGNRSATANIPFLVER